jgi:hypothetical protein
VTSGGWVEACDSKTIFGAPNDHCLAFSADQFATFLATRSGRSSGLIRNVDTTR